MCWLFSTAGPPGIPLICDVFRQWRCVWKLWPYTFYTLWAAKCYWIVYCRESQTILWPGVTTNHPLIYPCCCTALSDVLVYWGLKSLSPASGAGDFKRSTWILISSASLSQSSPVCRETLWERGQDGKGKGNLEASASGFLVCPWHCLWDRSRGRLPLLLQMLHPASAVGWPSQWAKLHFARIYWFFLERKWKCGRVVRAKVGGREKWKKQGSF